MPTKFLIIKTMTFLILKSDNIESSRIGLREIVWPAPSNQIKITFIFILPFNLVHFLIFFLFHIEIEEKRWVERGPKGMCPPPQIIRGGLAPLPPPPPPLPSPMVFSVKGSVDREYLLGNYLLILFKPRVFSERTIIHVELKLT